MKTFVKSLAMALAVGLAAPVMAGDVKDTVDEKGAEAKKGLRDAKPGDKTAADRRDDLKDSAKASKAKTKKATRKAGRKIKAGANDTKDAVHDATK
jgi:F0F1-type ATP synthase membrane subunit b/b'